MSGSRPIHLSRRGAIYLVRFRIPVDLAASIGMVELRRSLHTADPRIARRRCLLATAWFRRTMDELSKKPITSRKDLERAAIAFFDEMAKEVDQPRNFGADSFEQELSFNVDETHQRIRDLDDQLVDGAFDNAVKVRAIELVRQAGSDLEALPGTDKLFAERLAARAERSQMEFLLHLLTQPAAQYQPTDPLFGVLANAHARPAVSQLVHHRGIGLGLATKEYLRMKADRGLGHSQIEEVGRALGWLEERMGKDSPLAAISKEQLRQFRTDLSRLNVSLRGRAASFEDRLTDLPNRQIKSDTAIRYWRSVQAFFGWATAEGYIEEDRSAGLVLPRRKDEVRNSPDPFSIDELRHLFLTPLYSGYHSRKRLAAPGDCHRREAHWWSGVLFLHTGLRAGELAQLLPEDFDFDADVPHLKIRPENNNGDAIKSVKNPTAIRDVPLLPSVMKLGLREFVERQRKRDKNGRIFRDFRTGIGRNSDGLTKFWSPYLRKFGLWKPGRSTHVWRHGFIACLRANGVAEEDVQAVAGHRRNTVTAGYGGPYPLSRKMETLSHLDYGFDIISALGGPFDTARH